MKRILLVGAAIVAGCATNTRVDELERRLADLEDDDVVIGRVVDDSGANQDAVIDAYRRALQQERWSSNTVSRNTFPADRLASLSPEAKAKVQTQLERSIKDYESKKRARLDLDAKLTDEIRRRLAREEQVDEEIRKVRESVRPSLFSGRNDVREKAREDEERARRAAMAPIFTEAVRRICAVEIGSEAKAPKKFGTQEMASPYRYFDRYAVLSQYGKIYGVRLEAVLSPEFSENSVRRELAATTNDIIRVFQLDSYAATNVVARKGLIRSGFRRSAGPSGTFSMSVAGWDFSCEYANRHNDGHELTVTIMDSTLKVELDKLQSETRKSMGKSLPVFGQPGSETYFDDLKKAKEEALLKEQRDSDSAKAKSLKEMRQLRMSAQTNDVSRVGRSGLLRQRAQMENHVSIFSPKPCPKIGKYEIGDVITNEVLKSKTRKLENGIWSMSTCWDVPLDSPVFGFTNAASVVCGMDDRAYDITLDDYIVVDPEKENVKEVLLDYFLKHQAVFIDEGGFDKRLKGTNSLGRLEFKGDSAYDISQHLSFSNASVQVYACYRKNGPWGRNTISRSLFIHGSRTDGGGRRASRRNQDEDKKSKPAIGEIVGFRLGETVTNDVATAKKERELDNAVFGCKKCRLGLTKKNRIWEIGFSDKGRVSLDNMGEELVAVFNRYRSAVIDHYKLPASLKGDDRGYYTESVNAKSGHTSAYATQWFEMQDGSVQMTLNAHQLRTDSELAEWSISVRAVSFKVKSDDE